jgi:hypothetical protein
VEAVEPAHILAVAARLAAEARGVGATADRQHFLRQDFVAEKIGQRHLGRGHRIEAVDGGLIHLALLVGQLAGGGGAGGVDEDGRADLGVAGLDILIEEELQQGAHEPRGVADIERETGTGDLGPATEVEEPFESRDLPMRQGGGRDGLDRTMGGEDDIFLGSAALGHGGMGQVGQGMHGLLPFLFGLFEGGFLLLGLGGDGLHLGDLGEEFRRALGQGGHGGIGGFLSGAEGFGLLKLGTPSRIERQDGVEIDLEVFLGDGRADGIGRLAEEFGIEHGCPAQRNRAPE